MSVVDVAFGLIGLTLQFSYLSVREFTHMEVKFSLKVFVSIQTPYSSKPSTLVCRPVAAKFSSSVLVFRSDNLEITKSILVPRSSITISQWPDVLAKEHDSLNPLEKTLPM